MVYLISNPSFNIINEEIDKIIDKSLDTEVIDFNNITLEEIITLASYTSLFNDSKNIIVKNADFFSSKSNIKTDILEKYLNEPNEYTNLIFTTYEKLDERKKITKIIKDNFTLINIKPLNYKDINQRIIDYLKKKKYKITYDDANYITSASLNNYDIVIKQLEKITLFYSEPCEIKREDLNSIISLSLDDNNFRLIDTIVGNNYKDAIDMIQSFKIQHIEPVIIINLLAREYRLMLQAKKMYENKNNNIAIAKELNLQDWQVDKLLRNSFHYKIEEIENKILDLCNLDYNIKTSKIDKYLGLELLILKG